jgi:hypothetical protein
MLLQMESIIPEEYAASNIRDEVYLNPQSEGGVLLQNIGNHLQDHTVLQVRGVKSEPCLQNLVSYKM